MKSIFFDRHKTAFRMAGLVLILFLLVVSSILFVACKDKPETDGIFNVTITDGFKTDYYVGEKLVVGGELRVYYDVDFYSLVPITADMISGFDTSRSGNVIVAVTYKDHTATIPVTVHALKAISLTPDEDTLPTVVYENKPFPSTVTMSAVLSDGSSEVNVPVTANMLSGFDSSVIGMQNVTITYLGATTSFFLEVRKDTRVRIELVGEPKAEYSVNEPLSVQDAYLQVCYDSGKTDLATLTKELVSGFTTALGGEFDATVTYHGLTCLYHYFVVRAAVSFRLEPGSLPTVFEKGAPLPKGGRGIVTFDDGTELAIETLSTQDVPAFDTSSAGDHTVPVTVQGVSDEYNYTVLPAIVHYDVSYTEVVQVGTDFNYKGSLFVVYETEENETIAFDDERVTVLMDRFDTAGEVEQKVVFRTLEVTMPVLVCTEEEWNAVDRIDVAGSIGRSLVEGERLTAEDFSGVTLSIVYRYLGVRSDVSLAEHMSWVQVAYPTEALTENVSVLSVTISCYGVENTDLNVRMLSDAYIHTVTGLVVTGLRDVYAVGDVLPAELTFVAEYGGGYSYGPETSVSEAEISGFSTADPTDDAVLTISYDGCQKRYLYRVISRECADTVTMTQVHGLAPRLFVGDTVSDISLAGVTMTVTYGDGYRSETIAADLVEGEPFTEAGEATVTVSAEGHFAECVVTVHPAEDKTKVTAIRVPDILSAYVGSTVDRAQYHLFVTYGYGVSEEVLTLAAEGVTLSSYPNEKGRHSITVYYAGQSCNTYISVKTGDGGNEIDSVSFVAGYKAIFIQGEEFGGVEVTVRYKDGRNEKIEVTAEMVLGFSTETTGDKQATVNCYGTPLPYSYRVTTSEGQDRPAEGEETNEEN